MPSQLVDYWQDPPASVGLCYFDSVPSALTGASFSSPENKHEVLKEALLFVEGNHIDSAKRKHSFSPERVFKIVENTNKFLQSGGRIPWQQDHDKKQSANLGDLDGEITVRVISEADLPNPRAKHLIGKLGAFGQLVGRGAKAVAEIMSGNIKTLSPGVDIDEDIIREISATPTPAIVGLSTFRQGYPEELPTSWDDSASENVSPERREFEDLGKQLWDILAGIQRKIDPEFQYNSTLEALEGYFDRVEFLLLPEEPQASANSELPGMESSGRVTGNGGFDPEAKQKTQSIPEQQHYSQDQRELSLFSISDLLREKGIEFGRH